MENLGEETHYRGKGACLVAIKNDKGEMKKIVYKPRSVQPEIILETILATISNAPIF